MNLPRYREIPTIELFYICDDDFHQDIDKTRKKFNIFPNKEGIVETSDVLRFDVILRNDISVRNKYEKDITRLCQKYYIKDYYDDVEIFVESGLTPYSINPKGISKKIPITKPEIRNAYFKDAPEFLGCTITFHIRTAINSKDLQNWYLKYKEKLLIEANDWFKGSIHSTTKLEKLDNILQIIQLRDIKGLTFSQIADELCLRYPKDLDVVDGKINEVSVRKIYNRFKKRFKRDTH